MNTILKNRPIYLDRLIRFKDTEPVKVITGIRRCGKSSLLKLMEKYLVNNGIDKSQIISMNFESFEFRGMDVSDFYDYVKKRTIKDKKMYFFFDELQRIDKWEDAVNAFRIDFNCDIYITGSNAYLLSSEYSTYLSGRYVEIKMLPLSFKEFLDFNDFKIEERENLLGGRKKYLIGKDKEVYTIEDAFDSYLKYGGMPVISDIGLDQDKALALLDSIYSTVIVRDILDKQNRKQENRISDSILLKKIALFLADNIGNNVSITTIGNVLASVGLIDTKTRGIPNVHKIQAYVQALLESYFFYETKRFDIKGKDYLKTLGKYYIVDNGLRNYLLGFRERDMGHILENIVYLELSRRGFDIAIGKVGDTEIDFIATNRITKKYIQVTQSMKNEDVRKRELKPLMQIKDNYEKIILSLDNATLDTDYDGIKHINIIEWLLDT